MTRRLYPPFSSFPYPRIVAWILTLKCNLECIHCYPATDNVETTELTTEESKDCITEFASAGVKAIFMSGGEPLLKRDLLKLIRHGTEEGIAMFICSNATLLSETRARKLREAGMQGVYVGLEGVHSETVDKFSGVKGALERKIKGIRAALRAGLHTGVDFCCTAYNYHELENVIALARKLEVNEFSLKRFVPEGRGRANIRDLWMEPGHYEEVINIYCKHVLDPSGMKFISHEPLVSGRLQEMKPLNFYVSMCNIGVWCGITHNGDVLPCPMMPLKLGNLREKPLKDIWRNSYVVTDLEDKNKLKGQCGTCELRYNCGGCRACAYALTGDYLAEDANCWKIGKVNKRKPS